MQPETQTPRTTGKIEPVAFALTFSESPSARLHEAVETWEEADGLLREIAYTAPHGGAYHKTDFTIVFADGEEYKGRYDVQNIARERPNLRDHVRRSVGYFSGLVRPPHISQEDYAGHMKAYGDDTQRQWYELARDYAVGVATPEDATPEAAAGRVKIKRREARIRQGNPTAEDVAAELTPVIERLRELAGHAERLGFDHYRLDRPAAEVEELAGELEERS